MGNRPKTHHRYYCPQLFFVVVVVVEEPPMAFVSGCGELKLKNSAEINTITYTMYSRGTNPRVQPPPPSPSLHHWSESASTLRESAEWPSGVTHIIHMDTFPLPFTRTFSQQNSTKILLPILYLEVPLSHSVTLTCSYHRLLIKEEFRLQSTHITTFPLRERHTIVEREKNLRQLLLPSVRSSIFFVFYCFFLRSKNRRTQEQKTRDELQLSGPPLTTSVRSSPQRTLFLLLLLSVLDGWMHGYLERYLLEFSPQPAWITEPKRFFTPTTWSWQWIAHQRQIPN